MGRRSTISISSPREPQTSSTAVIERVKSDRLTLIAKINKSKNETIKATEVKRNAEEETIRLRLVVQAAEMDKQLVQQDIQNLPGVVELLRNKPVKSVDEFLNRLKLDLL